MRFLILFLLATVFSGCGVITRNIAKEACTGSSYNVAVCPGILDRMVPKAPAVKEAPKKELKCKVKVKTWKKGNMLLEQSSKTCDYK